MVYFVRMKPLLPRFLEYLLGIGFNLKILSSEMDQAKVVSPLIYLNEMERRGDFQRDGAVNLKGSHKMGDGWIFLKTSAPLSLVNTDRMSMISAGSIFAGQYL